MTYTTVQSTAVLKSLGFRVRSATEYRAALRVFQGGWNLGPWLALDGLNGPRTSAALARSASALKAGTGTASAHFSFREFRCACGGVYTGCQVILVRRELLRGLETYRAKVGHGVAIASGYRCPTRNQKVGGASESQHMYGCAADVGYALSATTVKALGVFAGIGRSRSTSKVRHVDRRDLSGHNNGGTLARPTQWIYSS